MSGSEASGNDDAPDLASSGRKMKEYSVKFKLQVAEWAIANRNNYGVHAGKPNIHAAAKHFAVSRKNVRRWVAQEAKLKERNKERRCKCNAQDLEEIMHGLELEAPEDPEDDAADIASDVSVVSGGEGNAHESVDEAEVEESDSDSEF